MAERQRSGKKSVTTTRNEAPALEPEEDRAVRMRYGFRLPDDVPLTKKSEGNAELEKKLLELEREAFRASGRLDRMRAEAASEEKAEQKKSKIVDRLTEPRRDDDGDDPT